MATTRVLGSKPSDCFQFRDLDTWICKTELPSDVIVEVDQISFHLHKFPLISHSATLQKLINDSILATSSDDEPCTVHLDDIPGGPDAFELVAKFCYDAKLELTAANVVPLRCAAEHLRMTPDFGKGNLIEATEGFLRDVVLGSWNDCVRALQACDDVLPQAEELIIVARCIDSLASKACADATLFGWPMLEYYTAREEPVVWNGITTSGGPRSPGADWWYAQVSSLRLPVYKRLIGAMAARGMSPENIAGSLTHYARRYLSGLHGRRSSGGGAAEALSEEEQRVLLEEVVALLPAERGAATTRFLLGLLRTAAVLHADAACRDDLEKRIGNQLEEAALEDLLIPNTAYSTETLYDVDCMQRMLEQFVLTNTSYFATPEMADCPPSAELVPVSTVAKLVDGYLAEVGTDPNLKLCKFQAIAALVPDYARALDDGLYRAIDIYLKAHPTLTDSEREQLCRLMNCQKLSLEACTHAAQNERLPLRMVVQVLFFEQVRLRSTVAGWFFVSDNAEQGSNSAHRDPPRKLVASEDEDDAARNSEQASTMSAEEIRQRVVELEEECTSMRQEIHRLENPKGPLARAFRKIGLRRSAPSSLELKRRPFSFGC